MKSAFGCTGREKNSAGAATDWVPCWWKGKNERFNPTDLCAEMKKKNASGKHLLKVCLSDRLQCQFSWLTDWFTCQWIIWLVYLEHRAT